MIDPLVSVPMAAHANPAATAAPLPDDDPQVLRSIACGLRVSPPTALHPLVDLKSRMLAHSDRLVLPSTTPPASRRLAISGASRRVMLPARARLPAVVGSSRVSTLSFTSTVRPISGRPACSAASASAGAWGLIAMTAFSIGPASSSFAIRWSCQLAVAPASAGTSTIVSSSPTEVWARAGEAAARPSARAASEESVVMGR